MKQTASAESGRADYVERLRESVAWLLPIRGVSQKRAAAMADIAPATLRNWLAGDADPTLGKLDGLADVLGLEEAYELLLPLDEIKYRYGQEGERLRPFVLRHPGTTRSLSPASVDSSRSTAVTASKGRFPARKRAARSARTAQGDASNRWCSHTRHDLHGWVRPSRETYRKGTYCAHRPRPAEGPTGVRETSDLLQVA